MARRGTRDTTLRLAALLLRVAARVRPRGEKWQVRADMMAGVARRDERFLKDEFQAEMAATGVFGGAIMGSVVIITVSLALSELIARTIFIFLASIFTGAMVAATVVFFAALHRRSWDSGPDVRQRRWPVVVALILGFIVIIMMLTLRGVL